MQFIKPTDGLITSFFSPQRKNPVTGILKPHTGADIGWHGTNDKVVAMASGKVVVPRYSNTAGNYIWIEHGNGYTTVYSHLKSILVKNGQQVKQGQQIGIKGTTGNSTGVHLHFEVIKHHTFSNDWNKKQNPLLFFVDDTTKQWQQWLNVLGYYKGAVDGIYGDGTIKAVFEYQKKNKLSADGVCGRGTYSHIKSAYNKSPKKTSPPSLSTITKKDDDELKFTSSTLKDTYEKNMTDKNKKELIEKAVSKLGYSKSWLNKKDVAEGDYVSMAISLFLLNE